MNNKEKLKQLKEKNEELKPIVFVRFKTKEELYSYQETIQNERDEYYSNLKEIERLEWEFLTPEEQEKKREQEKIAQLVKEGKFYEYQAEQHRKLNKDK